jgi:hypothetical protein
MSEHDEDGPATVMAETSKGRAIDINNVSGKRKVALIESGELSIDSFMTPGNMSGKRLKELREAHRERFEKDDKDKPNPYVVGNLVKYEGFVSEVLDVDGRKIKVRKANNKTSWVTFSKVEAVKPEE